MKSFKDSRIRDRYWQILIDGTGLYSFDERHCEHCLKKEHKNPDGTIKSTTYYHYVLEAKLVLNENIVFSIATEFVENEKSDVEKQDCELKAFYRLQKKLKENFKRLPICFTFDSLYACRQVFDICRDNNWSYIIRFKDGSIKTVAEEFHALKDIEKSQVFKENCNGIDEEYKYVTKINYEDHLLNIIEYKKFTDKGEKCFVFLTNMSISKRNYKQMVKDGRRRWCIENEGFNTQKNHGYNLQHLFSHNYNAMKNHYFLIQIGHMISQLIEQGLQVWKELNEPQYSIHEKLSTSFRYEYITEADLIESKKKSQVRFT